MRKLRKGDEVVVLVGRDRGRRGTVLSCVGENVLVTGINRVKKHVRPNPMQGEVGGIVEKDMPLPISNVALYNKATGKADRVGFRFLEDGKKVRFFKSTGELVDA
ncbi:MAG TPA: 50S ribosomal protein L24 [Rhodocyclaceae bacterium]|nr:50S ribosomal protein L24 [Rhodocyclaceae bacterium]